MSDTELPDDVGAELVAPRPAALIETFRAIGYNLPSAVADIIDNSISAGAKHIAVRFHWAEENSFATITDDGCGMDKEKLLDALRPGMAAPLSDRQPTDLGRFGLGLKTASFSQCRRLTVITRPPHLPEPIWRGWDLDFVVNADCWQVINYLSDHTLAEPLRSAGSGTVILWEKLDRIIFDQNKTLITKAKFYEAVRDVERHLSMVFHRFIETRRLNIALNGNPVVAWDPFLIGEPATQSFPEELYDNGRISMKGFVLPHSSKISAEKFEQTAGSSGWTAQQGFYIYRKDRILVAGDWLDLFKKDDFTRLARIMVEIDSALDFSWQIDIRKSKAQPPKMFLDILKRYGAEIRKNAIEVYRHRGKQKQRRAGRSTYGFVWETSDEQGREVFKINRKHPALRLVRDQLGMKKSDLDQLIRLLEMTLPVQAIVFNETRYADQPVLVRGSDEEVALMMRNVYQKLLADGLSENKAKEELYFIDPFSNYPHLLESIT